MGEVRTTNRCQSVMGNVQCTELVVPGTDYCEKHLRRADEKLYQLNSYFARQTELANNPKARTLTQEIALARASLEKLLAVIKTDQDHLALFEPIQKQIRLISEVIKTANQMDLATGQALTRDTVIRMAHRFVEIIVEELEGVEGYEDIVDRIIARFRDTISSAKNDPKSVPKKLPLR